MLSRSRKEEIVSGIKQDIDAAGALFLTNLIGVPSNTSNEVRKKVRDAKGKVVVTRNTLFRRAAEGTKAEKLLANLKGPHAIAFAFEDAPGVAKALHEAGKENEVISLIGGFLGDKELTAGEVVSLAKLPSREQMLATLLATFNAPISAFARVLNAIREQKESEGGAVEVVGTAPETPAEPADDKTEEKPE